RGGDITYHGPGQLIISPIFKLKERGFNAHGYLHLLEEVTIRTLKSYGIEGQRIEGLRGVWVGEKKVAAVGIAIRRWTTFHGFCLNANMDLRPFSYIIPCGIRHKKVTSLQELLGQDVDMDQLKEQVRDSMAAVFGLEIAAVSREGIEDLLRHP
ncbi:lipoyl(octanoyl) transferase LipB, partial [Candidatus Hakubella thermalkaliphila]